MDCLLHRLPRRAASSLFLGQQGLDYTRTKDGLEVPSKWNPHFLFYSVLLLHPHPGRTVSCLLPAPPAPPSSPSYSCLGKQRLSAMQGPPLICHGLHETFAYGMPTLSTRPVPQSLVLSSHATLCTEHVRDISLQLALPPNTPPQHPKPDTWLCSLPILFSHPVPHDPLLLTTLAH